MNNLKIFFLFCVALIAQSQYDDEYGGDGDRDGGDDYGDYGDKNGFSSAKEIKTVEEMKLFMAEDEFEPFVIGFFDPSTNSNDKDVFEEVASKESGLRFAFSTAKEVLEEYKYDGCAVLVYKPAKLFGEKYEKQKARYPSKTLKAESLTKFVLEKSAPVVGLKTKSSSARLEKVKTPVVTAFLDVDLDKNLKTWTYYANRLRKIAQDFKGKVLFEIADKNDFDMEMADHDIELVAKTDVGVGIRSGNLYYKMTDTYSPENVKKFVDDFIAGRLVGKEKKKYTPPKDDEDGDDSDSHVVTLTDANFDEEVTNADKDVMLEFYAPWCGHCKSLKPVYKGLAEKLKDVPTVSIAAMDATANTVPKGYTVEGYPTILFVSAKDKKPIPYNGARDEESMAQWIQKHAGHPFTL
jgi:protein disulfide isomerase family A protein 3